MTRRMRLLGCRRRVILNKNRKRRNVRLTLSNATHINTSHRTNHPNRSIIINKVQIIMVVTIQNSLTVIASHQAHNSWTTSHKLCSNSSQTNYHLHKITDDAYTWFSQTVIRLVKDSTRLLILFVPRPLIPTLTIMAVMLFLVLMQTWSSWRYRCTYHRCTYYVMKDEPLNLDHYCHSCNNNNTKKKSKNCCTTNKIIIRIRMIII